MRRDVEGDTWDRIGHGLGLTIKWQVNRHASLLFRYSHLWADGFIQYTGPKEDPDLFYVQYNYRF